MNKYKGNSLQRIYSTCVFAVIPNTEQHGLAGTHLMIVV